MNLKFTLSDEKEEIEKIINDLKEYYQIIIYIKECRYKIEIIMNEKIINSVYTHEDVLMILKSILNYNKILRGA